VRTFCKKGVLQLRTSARFVEKTSVISIFMTCPHGQGELNRCGHFADKEEGSVFHNFVRTSFVDNARKFYSVFLPFERDLTLKKRKIEENQLIFK